MVWGVGVGAPEAGCVLQGRQQRAAAAAGAGEWQRVPRGTQGGGAWMGPQWRSWKGPRVDTRVCGLGIQASGVTISEDGPRAPVHLECQSLQ